MARKKIKTPEELSFERLCESRDFLEKCSKETINPRILQDWNILRLNQNFIKDIEQLKKKWKDPLEKDRISGKKIHSFFKNNCKRNKIDKPNIYDFMKTIVGKKESSDFHRVFKKSIKFYFNKKLDNDLLKIAKKYKLYPLAFWINILRPFFFSNYFLNPFLIGKEFIRKGEVIFQSSGDRLETKIINDKKTGEKRLSLVLFDDCSLVDIKSHWNYISYKLKEIRKEKIKGKKRYYPRNLDTAKTLVDLDRRKGLSDYEKADELWGESKGVSKTTGRRETKRKNKVKNIRYRTKKL